MKTRVLLLALMMTVGIVLFAGCSAVTPTNPPSPTTTVDAAAGASFANDEASFAKAVSEQGAWIIYTTGDLTISQAHTVKGTFKDGKKDAAGNDTIQRKIALYDQDADRNVTARYTLTIPELTIQSPKASIQHGTLKGDVIVDVDDFALIDAQIEGNLYFTKQEYKDSFTMDADSSVSGKNEVKSN